MATYAAFKHVELHKVGYGKNRVPNAPRGRINEIFGGEGSPGMRAADSPVRPKDTHSRLFGPADPPNFSVKDHLKSNISFGEERSRLSSANGHPTRTRTPARRPLRRPLGHPQRRQPALRRRLQVHERRDQHRDGPRHSRVPPGGYSSGLW